jgi:protein-S-isoprenylcysteine O-methyltransferase Ste14
MYLGFALLLTGWGMGLGDWLGLLVPPAFVLLVTFVQILPEEQALAMRFGEDYAAYRRRVGRWLGPVRHGAAEV